MWRDPETNADVMTALRGGEVPPAVHTMFMNLIVRSGRSDASLIPSIVSRDSHSRIRCFELRRVWARSPQRTRRQDSSEQRGDPSSRIRCLQSCPLASYALVVCPRAERDLGDFGIRQRLWNGGLIVFRRDPVRVGKASVVDESTEPSAVPDQVCWGWRRSVS